MNTILKTIQTLALTALTVVGVLFFNFSIITNLLIPDPCAYETGDIEPGMLINLFFEISSTTAYHPEPSVFNFFFTIGVGIILGGLASYKLIWKKSKVFQ